MWASVLKSVELELNEVDQFLFCFCRVYITESIKTKIIMIELTVMDTVLCLQRILTFPTKSFANKRNRFVVVQCFAFNGVTRKS